MQPPILLSEPSRRVFRILSAFGDAAGSAWQRHLHRRRLKSTIRQLEGLSDFALKDIGLHRCEIAAAVMRSGDGSIADQQTDTCAAPEASNDDHWTGDDAGERHARWFVHRI